MYYTPAHDESLRLLRGLASEREDAPAALLDLAGGLSDAAYARRLAGDSTRALADVEESLALHRRIAATGGESAQTLGDRDGDTSLMSETWQRAEEKLTASSGKPAKREKARRKET